MIGLLTKLDKVDVVLNPNKFANRSVDFAGFRISYNSRKPFQNIGMLLQISQHQISMYEVSSNLLIKFQAKLSYLSLERKIE